MYLIWGWIGLFIACFDLYEAYEQFISIITLFCLEME